MESTVVSMAAAEAPLILTIDIGSSSARATLFDRRGRAVAGCAAQERYTLRAAVDGAAEDDPDEAIARLARCVDAALAQIGPLAGQIAAVGVDAMSTTLMGIDAAGRPVTPLRTYADTRAAPDAESLRRSLDEAAVHDRTGCLLRASYWPAQLAWLRRSQPERWRAAARWVTLGEYLELRLFGRCRVSLSAAAWGGLMQRRGLCWDEPLLEELGLTMDQLSPLVDVDAPLSGLGAFYAARWPALRDIPWMPAVGDGAAANIGSGCVGPGQIALTMGTTGAMRVARPEVAQGLGLWCYRVDRGLALLGGATSEGGNVYAWLRQTTRLGEPGEVEAALAALPADGHGLTVLPFLAGERSPGWAGNVQATIHGLTLATTPLDILRAGLEAVSYRLAVIAERLAGPPQGGQQIIASGGALLSSPAWMQIMADVLGRPVVASAESEATSRGAALLALRTIGALPSLEDAGAAEGRAYAPDGARHARYQEAIARQARLYDQLIGRDR